MTLRILSIAGLLSILGWLGCAASHHTTAPASLGTPTSSDAMFELLSEPGPVSFERVIAADWVVSRGGLINLDHPRAKAAQVEDGDEPIQIYFYALQHPQFGTFIVDSGLETGFRDPAGNERVGAIVRAAMKTDTLRVRTTTREWLDRKGVRLAGVFLTHIHLDHILGIPDIDADTVVYAGPGETDASQFTNLFARSTTDSLLEPAGPLQEWQFEPDPSGRFAGVIDVFGDGSVFALHVPGHSPGSTAFVVRTPDGPKLLTGDASHTRWGWENGVEPGSFSLDGPRSAESLATLLELSERFPQLAVYLGHQSLEAEGPLASAY